MKVADLTLGKHIVVLLVMVTVGCATTRQYAGPAFLADVMGYQ
ncbi:MAG: hypothetical protein ACI8PB_003794 [Desulforhopalus sp.]|jgi:hypothetical protein